MQPSTQSAKPTVLFVCTGNAGRSQIAQALFHDLAGDDVAVLSGGVDPWKDLHPVARRLLDERGLDTAGLHPKHVKSFTGRSLDWVVTIGDRTRAETPRLGGNPARLHWDLADPADADGTGREEATFRQTFQAIGQRLPGLLERMKQGVRASVLRMAPGISTCIVRPARFDPSVHLPSIAAAGFRCIELNFFFGSDDFPWDRAAAVNDLRRVAQGAGVAVFAVHAEGGLGGYRGARTERLAVDLCKAYADLAAQLGAPVVTIHAGLDPVPDRATAVTRLRSSIEELARHVLEMPCRYGWENEPLGLSTAEHLQWIRDLDPGTFGLVLDNGHSHIRGTTEAYLEACEGVLCNLHLHDNNGKTDAHQLPGTGSFRWDGFRARLERCGYVGPLMIEAEMKSRSHELTTVLKEARESVDRIDRPGAAAHDRRDPRQLRGSP